MRGGHAARSAFTDFRTFQKTKAFFKYSDGRIAVPAVDVTLVIVLERRLGFFGGVVNES